MLEGKLPFLKLNTQEINHLTPAKKKKKREVTYIYTHTQCNHHHQLQNRRNQVSLVIGISQYQWSKFPNKKAQTTRMNVKTGSLLLMHPRNKPQHQEKGKGLGNYILSKQT